MAAYSATFCIVYHDTGYCAMCKKHAGIKRYQRTAIRLS